MAPRIPSYLHWILAQTDTSADFERSAKSKLPVFFLGEKGAGWKRNRKWSWIPVESILRGHGWCKLEWVFCRCVWFEFGVKRNCWCTCKLLVCPHLLFLFLDHVCCVWVIFQKSWGTFFHQDVCWFYIQLSLNDSTCCGNRQHMLDPIIVADFPRTTRSWERAGHQYPLAEVLAAPFQVDKEDVKDVKTSAPWVIEIEFQ